MSVDLKEKVASYFEGTRSGSAAKWMSAFASNAIVDDPVGTPNKTTQAEIKAMGEGFLGAFESIGLHEEFVHVVGNEAVARWTGRGRTHDGQDVQFDGINYFEFNDAGEIVLLRGFFTPPG
ncbi:MAG: nuclear transport factor 2 family protein [Pseudomonadota bacterium]